ncbi:MAG: FAD-dependent oxidoreductase, partial [Oscillospiraceae bacterium]
MQQYDVIVIGAGNGGLAAAATLAEKGKKVILFEKHNIPGGCGTSFRRGRFEFEVALHQLSSMGTPQKPGALREQFRRYGIEDKIEWIEIKELFRVNFPDGTGISIPAERKACEAHLCSKFPKEKDAILKYFEALYAFCAQSAEFAKKSAQSTEEPGAMKKAIMKAGFPKIYPELAKYALKSTQEVLDEFFKDVKLKLSLSAYWCFMGMPPARFPWSILAKCTNFYMEDKPFYLRGTSMMMSQAIMDATERMGGVVELNCGVERIILENGAAVGVVDEEGREYRAKKIVSNISPLATYGALLRPEEVPQAAREYLKPYTVGIS